MNSKENRYFAEMHSEDDIRGLEHERRPKVVFVCCINHSFSPLILQNLSANICIIKQIIHQKVEFGWVLNFPT